MTAQAATGRGKNSALLDGGSVLASVPVEQLLVSGGFGRCKSCRPGQLCATHLVETREIVQEVGEPGGGFYPTGGLDDTQVMKVIAA